MYKNAKKITSFFRRGSFSTQNVEDLTTEGRNTIEFPPDTNSEDREILRSISNYTMTGIDRQLAAIDAARYIVRRNISGDIVECGVWRGGSSMGIALTLLQEGVTDRIFYLYDTFSGMTKPTEKDSTWDNQLAEDCLTKDVEKNGIWCIADITDVNRNMISTSYPEEMIKYIEGDVLITLPSRRPAEKIAILRLDTDWYESTKHELEHLFPLLSDGGVLIIDDYGHWKGAKQAVDEYFGSINTKYYMHRIDYTGRLIIKL